MNRRLATLLCFFVPLIAYSITAARSPQGGDTSEFGVIGFLGGVAHPPGYPIYSLIVRLFAHLPFGPLFWRVSMSSAVIGAIACAVLFRLLLKVTGDVAASLVTALVFALSPIVWRLSGVPEVFSLHALMCALLVLASLWITEASDSNVILRRSFWLGLISGLGMANHQTTALLAPIPIWAVIVTWKRLWSRARPLAFGLATTGFVIGLSAYLLIPLFVSSATADSLVWGRADTLDGFITHLLRREYGTFRLSPNSEPVAHSVWNETRVFLMNILQSYVYVLVPVGSVGAVIAFRKRRGFVIALGIALLLCTVFIARINLPDTRVDNDIAARFQVMPLLLLAIPISFGVASVRTRLSAGSFVALAVLLIAGGSIAAFRDANWPRDRTIERYFIAATQPLEKDAVVLVSGDGREAAGDFIARVEGVRPDVHFIDVPLFPGTWYFDRKQREMPTVPLLSFQSLEVDGRFAAELARYLPVYEMPNILKKDDTAFAIEQLGFLNRIRPAGWQPNQFALEHAEATLRVATDAYGPSADAADGWTELIQSDVAHRWQALAEEYRTAGRDDKYLELGNQALTFFPRRWIESADAAP